MEDYCCNKKMRLVSPKPSDHVLKPTPPNVSLQLLPSLHQQTEEQKDQNNNNSAIIGRERLKRHREEVAGLVVVPERWGKEDVMQDWIDYSSFDKLLAPKGLRSAREALIVDAQRRRQAIMTIESRC